MYILDMLKGKDRRRHFFLLDLQIFMCLTGSHKVGLMGLQHQLVRVVSSTLYHQKEKRKETLRRQ
jgi:hypothetical protein